MSAGTVGNHRGREKGVLVYPVYSRRAGGLSVGINLFPDRKVCSFDCPYCEVFPFENASCFSLSAMESRLEETLREAALHGMDVRDICFSGNGEPTQSPHFEAALKASLRIRDAEAPSAKTVVITNGAGLLGDACFDLLRRAACGSFTRGNSPLDIWLKLDAGTPEWYKAVNRSDVPFRLLAEKIRAFVKAAPVTLQTMVCTVNGQAPSKKETQAWEAFVAELASCAAEIRLVQIYGKARPAPEDPVCEALCASFLEARAQSLRALLASRGKGEIPVRVF